MQFTKFTRDDAIKGGGLRGEHKGWSAYVEHKGVLYHVCRFVICGNVFNGMMLPLFRRETWKLSFNSHEDWDDFYRHEVVDRIFIKDSEGEYEYFDLDDAREGVDIYVPHDDYLGFKIALKLLRAGWSMEQIAKVKRFATQEDMTANKRVIFAVLLECGLL